MKKFEEIVGKDSRNMRGKKCFLQLVYFLADVCSVVGKITAGVLAVSLVRLFPFFLCCVCASWYTAFSPLHLRGVRHTSINPKTRTHLGVCVAQIIMIEPLLGASDGYTNEKTDQ